MLASIVTVASALVASAAAAAVPSALSLREVYATWPAENFFERCSPGGCSSRFNISAPAGYVDGAPAFNVTCHPIYIQQGWTDCDVLGELPAGSYVKSLWAEASQRELINISVSHVWLEGETRYNASGSVEFPGDATSFEVPVTLLTAVL